MTFCILGTLCVFQQILEIIDFLEVMVKYIFEQHCHLFCSVYFQGEMQVLNVTREKYKNLKPTTVDLIQFLHKKYGNVSWNKHEVRGDLGRCSTWCQHSN